MRHMSSVSLVAAVCLSVSGTVFGETKWDMPTPYGDGVHHTKNIRAFAEDVQTATNGELVINVHSGASLFKHGEIHRAVRTGQVPIGEVFMGLLGNNDPVYKLDNLPFLASDFESARKLWAASRPEVEKSLAKEGLMLLYAMPWPAQGLYSSNKIEKLSDIKGAKMRSYSATLSRLSVLLEATPTTVQTPEIPQAFSTGMINMMITSPTTGVSSQSWDYVSNYNDIRAWIPKNMVFVNKRKFMRLPEAAQKAVLDAAARAEQRGWEMAIEETSINTAKLAEHGIIVSEPDAKLVDDFKKIGEVMVKEWDEEIGESGQTILNAYQK